MGSRGAGWNWNVQRRRGDRAVENAGVGKEDARPGSGTWRTRRARPGDDEDVEDEMSEAG
jgi:hypothetical protein